MPDPGSVSSSLILFSDLEDGAVVAVDALIDGDRESVIVHRRGRELNAWLNVCPHAGRRLDYAPGKFLREPGRLVCAAHGAVFRLEDGLCLLGPCRGSHLRALPVRVGSDGWVEIG